MIMAMDFLIHCHFVALPKMGDSLEVKVGYRLGSRNLLAKSKIKQYNERIRGRISQHMRK